MKKGGRSLAGVSISSAVTPPELDAASRSCAELTALENTYFSFAAIRGFDARFRLPGAHAQLQWLKGKVIS